MGLLLSSIMPIAEVEVVGGEKAGTVTNSCINHNRSQPIPRHLSITITRNTIISTSIPDGGETAVAAAAITATAG